jgi:nitrogen fixation-related uncharacterized protein
MKPVERTSERELGLKKLQLEVQRLELEQKKYDDRLALSDRKLRSDLRDWYYRLFIALASTLVGIVTFLWTQSYQRYSDDLKATSSRIQEEDGRFGRSLGQLTDSSAAIRMAAADSLVEYVRRVNVSPEVHPTMLQRLWRRIVGAGNSDESFKLVNKANDQRREEALHVAADRLLSEDDVHVMEVLSRIILSAGVLAIEPVAEANRTLANDFARTYGTSVAISVPNKTEEACDAWDSRNKQLTELDLLLTRQQMPLQRDLKRLQFAPSKFLKHSFTIREFVSLQCHMDIAAMRASVPLPKQEQVEKTLVRQARGLALTSYVLTEIMLDPALKKALEGTNLEEVQLVTGTGLRRFELSKLSLARAYLSGTPEFFMCRECDLRYSSLQDLDLANGADLRTSKIDGAHFPAAVGSNVRLPAGKK